MQSCSCATGTEIPTASQDWMGRFWRRVAGTRERPEGSGASQRYRDAESRERPRGSGGSGAGGGREGARGEGNARAAGGDELEEQEGEEMLGHRHNAALPAIYRSARRGPGASAVSRALVPCRRPTTGAESARSRRRPAPSAPKPRSGQTAEGPRPCRDARAGPGRAGGPSSARSRILRGAGAEPGWPRAMQRRSSESPEHIKKRGLAAARGRKHLHRRQRRAAAAAAPAKPLGGPRRRTQTFRRRIGGWAARPGRRWMRLFGARR